MPEESWTCPRLVIGAHLIQQAALEIDVKNEVAV
jgi:hypothetical protein